MGAIFVYLEHLSVKLHCHEVCGKVNRIMMQLVLHCSATFRSVLGQVTYDKFYFVCVNYRYVTMAHLDSLNVSREDSRTAPAVLFALCRL